MEYAHLKLWKHPDCYLGATWPDYFVVTGQHRDSDKLTKSNFAVIKARLEEIEATLTTEQRSPVCCVCSGKGCEDCSNDGTVPCFVNPYESHWAVGHVEWLGLHKDSPAVLLESAETMLESIAQYPILDESHFSNLEYSEAMYRFILDRPRFKTYTEKGKRVCPVAMPMPDKGDTWEWHNEWFVEKLASVAESCGTTKFQLLRLLLSKDAVKRAIAYQSIVGYFGVHEFDQYPVTLTESEAQKRYKKIKL